jgi:hypothetical protein
MTLMMVLAGDDGEFGSLTSIVTLLICFPLLAAKARCGVVARAAANIEAARASVIDFFMRIPPLGIGAFAIVGAGCCNGEELQVQHHQKSASIQERSLRSS